MSRQLCISLLLSLLFSGAPAFAGSQVTILTNNFAGPDASGAMLLEQFTGTNEPFADTNTVPLDDSTNGLITIGQPEQWHFFVVSNDTPFTNAAFLIFPPPELALARVGITNAGVTNIALLPEADLDLYVSTDPALTNLDPNAIIAADKSLRRGSAETILYSNAAPAVYYLGVKAESQRAADFGVMAAFSQLPIAASDAQGNQLLSGLPLAAPIPAGSPAAPGQACVLCVAPDPILVRRVIVTNTLTHPAMSNLLGVFSHAGTSVVLNNHSTNGAVLSQPFVYDDSGEADVPAAQPSAGPGSLSDFAHQHGSGQWQLTMLSTNLPGTDDTVYAFIESQQDLLGTNDDLIQPGACRNEYLFISPNATNLLASFSLLSGAGPASITLCPANVSTGDCPQVSLSGSSPDASLSIDNTSHPPLGPGWYVLQLCNLGASPADIAFSLALGMASNAPPPLQAVSAAPTPIGDDAITTATIHVTNQSPIVSASIGVRIAHPRVSDLALSLISPDGTSVLLSENRGGDSAEGMGFDNIATDVPPTYIYGGGPFAVTNVFDTGQTSGSLAIDYQMYTQPDDMRVYYDGVCILDTDYVSGSGANIITYGPGDSTLITVVMNQDGNPDPDTVWDYTLAATHTNHCYLTFTDNPDLAALPIKFAPPPFTNLTYLSLYPGDSPSNGIFYLPEQSLGQLAGQSPAGDWTLQINDDRPGATNPAPLLLSWQLSFLLQNTVPAPVPLDHGLARTITLSPGQIQQFTVDVPAWAASLSNALLSASAPVNLLFNQYLAPSGTNSGDFVLLSNATSGSAVLQTNSLPPLLPGATCYLGIQNTNSVPVTFTYEVSFNVTPLANGVALSAAITPGPLPQYYSFDVSTDETSVSFQLLNLSGNASLVANNGLPFPTLDTFLSGSFNPGADPQQIILLTNSSPVSLSPGTWYLGVFDTDVTNVSYTILASAYTNSVPTITPLYSGISRHTTIAGPANAADYYLFTVSTDALRAQFEINGPTANLILLARRGLPLPDPGSYDLRSANPGTNDQLIVLYDYSAPIPLTPGDWFLAVLDPSGAPASYSIAATEFFSYGTNITILPPLLAGGSFCLTWNSLPGVHYFVQGKIALTDPSWTTLSPTLTATDYQTSYCAPLTFHFFRVGEGLVLVPVPPVISSIALATNGVLLQWTASNSPSALFQLQWTPSLAPPSWTSFTNLISPSNGACSFLDDGSQTGGFGPARYYRLLQLP